MTICTSSLVVVITLDSPSSVLAVAEGVGALILDFATSPRVMWFVVMNYTASGWMPTRVDASRRS